MKKAVNNLRMRDEDCCGLSREDSPSPVLSKERMSESLPPAKGYKVNRKPLIKTIEVMDAKDL
jgi:hypothetical protein